MANFDATTEAKRELLARASGVLDQFRSSYQAALAVKTSLNEYTTNPTFAQITNFCYTSTERAEMQAVSNAYNAFIAVLEAHPALIGLV